MTNKTIFQIEQRIKDGCGEIINSNEGYNYCGKFIKCSSCQRELRLIQEIKGIIESFGDLFNIGEPYDGNVIKHEIKGKLLGGKG